MTAADATFDLPALGPPFHHAQYNQLLLYCRNTAAQHHRAAATYAKLARTCRATGPAERAQRQSYLAAARREARFARIWTRYTREVQSALTQGLADAAA